MIHWIWFRLFYRPVMRMAHRFNWHYAPPIFPEGNTLLWCQWCGLRYVAARSTHNVHTISKPATPAPALRRGCEEKGDGNG